MTLDLELKRLIDVVMEKNASDLILTEGREPMIRVVGDLMPASDRVLTSEDVRRMAYSALSREQIEGFEAHKELDASFAMDKRARFRLNVFYQRSAVAAVMRMLPAEIPSFAKLGVPSIVERWLAAPHGLIITTGPTGSGKSTTQAAMIGHLNRTVRGHIITIEDPIEYAHPNGSCVIEQREVGSDTVSFPAAIRHLFRQNPDIIMIGEMRDHETFEGALRLAETGHLVLATLHTGDAVQAISRIVDMFPAEQQSQIRLQLSLVLSGILVQELVPGLDGQRRHLAVEILDVNSAVRNLIRKSEIPQIYSVLETGSQTGMQTMNASLMQLILDGKISVEQAMLHTTRKKELEALIQRRMPANQNEQGKAARGQVLSRL